MFANFSFTGSKSLKELIRSIRACKTAADERTLIAKESALIRSSFREATHNSNSRRYKNVAKLLYIHMLGYPGGNWAQIECLKLMASAKFFEKRLGYLGIMLLMDESMETLTLVTNSLKNDLNSPNIYIVGLALSAFNSISSSEMAKDLCTEIEKHFTNANPCIRKKVALCAVRIVRKVPELYESFLQKSKNLISNERNNGILMTGIALIIELCQINSTIKNEYRKLIPVFIRLYTNLLQSSSADSTEYEVSGIIDPFLQVKLLRLLQILGHGDIEASNQMNELLSFIASTTDQTKMAGNAVLYEAIGTIFGIEADYGLKITAVNLLGNFLSNKDNNMRYVALNTLSKVIEVDPEAVQRHRTVILECLYDPDISIRKRALELCFAIVNDNNVQLMIRELLRKFESGMDDEFLPFMTLNLLKTVERFAINSKWFVDHSILIFKLAKEEIKEESVNNFLKHIAYASSDLQSYATYSLYDALKGASCHMIALIQAAAWCIGEFGQYLIISGVYEGVHFHSVSEREVFQLLTSLVSKRSTSIQCKYYLLTGIGKLAVRYQNLIGDVKLCLKGLCKDDDHDMELHQRAMEYYQLFDDITLRKIVFDRMPVPEARVEKRAKSSVTTHSMARNSSMVNLLSGLDLMSLQNEPSDEAGNLRDAPSPGPGIDDVYSAGALAPKSTFKSTSVPAAAASHLKEVGEYYVYQNGGLEIYLTRFLDASDPSIITLRANFYNHSEDPDSAISDLLFQAAVPKSMKLHMNPASDNRLSPNGGQVIQILKILNPNHSSLKLRLKISFRLNDEEISDMCDFTFPEIE